MSMQNLSERMNDLLKTEVIDRHSLFQLKYFVVGKEPTHQSQLWRCLRELKSRKDAIDSINLEIEDLKDKIQLMDINIEETKAKTGVRAYFEEKKKIKLRILNRNRLSLSKSISSLELKLKYAQEEAEFFILAYDALSKIEAIKPWDDLESQTEYWHEKLSQTLNLKLILNQPVDVELISTIFALDNKSDLKQSLINTIEKRKQKLIAMEKNDENLKLG